MLKKSRKKLSNELETSSDSGDSEVQMVFADLMTFLMMLFVLLFVLSYNENKEADFITELQIRFGDKKEEKQQSLTTDALLISKIDHYIQKEKLEDQTQVIVDEHRVKIILESPLLFDSGKAIVKPVGQNLLKGISDIFKEVLNPIVVEGHTDNVPIHNDDYQSNWELSFHRAYNVIKLFVYKFKFSPRRLSAIGYGEYKPMMTNDTKENRAVNRRIELNIIRISESVTEQL